MVNLDIIKESLIFEKILDENSSDIPFKEEYLIPDTQPDVYEILSVDSNIYIYNKEVQNERILLEYKVECNVMYLAMEEGLAINSVVYKEKNSSFIDIAGAEHSMMCDIECNLEHINANIINERKIKIEGKLKTKYKVYKEEKIDFIKDLEGIEDLQIKKKLESVEKNITNRVCFMNGQKKINVGMDKPQIGKIIKCGYMVHKQEIKLGEDKIQASCLVKINVMYRAYDSKEIICLEEDLYIISEEEAIGVNADMNCSGYFEVKDHSERISQNDLGESRVVDVELSIDANVKVSKVEFIETIEDLYSLASNVNPLRGICKVNMGIDEASNEVIVKGYIDLNKDLDKITDIVDCMGHIVDMESYFENHRVVIKGNIEVGVIYKTIEEEKFLGKINGKIPFEVSLDMSEAESGMVFDVKANIEELTGNIEANTIAVKALMYFHAKCSDVFEKEYIEDIEQIDGITDKNASVIIYTVQKGDTLWNLAKKYKTTIDDLVKLNDIEDEDKIYTGDKLMIPGRALL